MRTHSDMGLMTARQQLNLQQTRYKLRVSGFVVPCAYIVKNYKLLKSEYNSVLGQYFS